MKLILMIQGDSWNLASIWERAAPIWAVSKGLIVSESDKVFEELSYFVDFKYLINGNYFKYCSYMYLVTEMDNILTKSDWEPSRIANVLSYQLRLMLLLFYESSYPLFTKIWKKISQNASSNLWESLSLLRNHHRTEDKNQVIELKLGLI